MVEEKTQAQAGTAPEPTEADLLKQMQEATKSGDFKQVAKVAGELVKFQKAKEQAERDAKLKALQAIETDVKVAIVKALQPFIDSGKLDMADGVWFTYDFSEKLDSIRLMRQSKPAGGGKSGGGGGGKKFAVDTSDLLEKFGNQEYKDGLTFNQAWEKDNDKNWRYTVREKLLKLGGCIQ
jgi:hypothetical protein